MIATPVRVAFLRRIHLFHDLKDDELISIAEKLKEEVYEQGKNVFEEGESAARFFLIYNGEVNITQMLRKKTVDLATLVGGDYFGEEALFEHRKRSATVKAVVRSSMFSMTRDEFNELIKQFPKMKAAFEVSIASRRLARRLHFGWLRPDEVVYFVARKHPVLLYNALWPPVAALIVPAVFLAFFLYIATRPSNYSFTLLPLGLSLMSLILVILWAIWRVVDWGNDYYIVTNQRVVWLEKVVGIYDSRQEAPLSTILSVGVETDMLGRAMDYGHVVVRTFVGKIPFNHVAHPYEASHMVEEQWHRTRASASHEEKEAMRNVLREKLGLTKKGNVVGEASKPSKPAPVSAYKPGFFTIMAANLFKNSTLFRVRFVVGETITYRKHIFVLFKQIAWPTFLLLGCIGLIGFRIYIIASMSLPWVDVPLILLLLFTLYPMGKFVYEYMDWSNDIFQVTEDQILDIDRKPFGTEERRAAPLESILSIRSERLGISGHFFNYGTVYITVGGTQLVFEDVFDPTAVQLDIDNRRIARKNKQDDARVAAERERMSDWLLAYHENADEFRRQQNEAESEQKNE